MNAVTQDRGTNSLTQDIKDAVRVGLISSEIEVDDIDSAVNKVGAGIVDAFNVRSIYKLTPHLATMSALRSAYLIEQTEHATDKDFRSIARVAMLISILQSHLLDADIFSTRVREQWAEFVHKNNGEFVDECFIRNTLDTLFM